MNRIEKSYENEPAGRCHLFPKSITSSCSGITTCLLSPVLEFPPPLLYCDDKGAMTLDLGFRREQKQTTKIKKNSSLLCLPCATSPWPRSCVRKENQTKDIRKEYSASTRMEHVQTKSIDYYSPLSPPSFLLPLPISV